MPANPPSTAATASRLSRRPWPASSGREALTEPTLLSTSATVLVTLAVTGGMPAASSAGELISEASPAMLPVSPAPTPASTRRANSPTLIGSGRSRASPARLPHPPRRAGAVGRGGGSDARRARQVVEVQPPGEEVRGDVVDDPAGRHG